MLKMLNVSYQYKNRNKAQIMVLEDINLEFEKGNFYTIYGASGRGKTTCLSLLGGLDEPTKGTITLDNVDIKKIGYNNLRKKYVAYVFQDFHLFPYMTAIENVLVGIDAAGKIDNKTDSTKHAIDILNSLGLVEPDISRVVTKLSGGQLQRVAIARALGMEAEYILADEPTGNLDKKNTQNIIEIFKRLANEGKCIITVTHSEKVKEACDICYSLEE